MLPLINKRWARVLSGPSDAWDSVDFYVRAPADQPPPDPMAAFTWFMRRPGYETRSWSISAWACCSPLASVTLRNNSIALCSLTPPWPATGVFAT